MSFLKDFLLNLAAFALVMVACVVFISLLFLPIILGEYVAPWLAYVTFALYFLLIVAGATASERRDR